jgi:hypothetical protein
MVRLTHRQGAPKSSDGGLGAKERSRSVWWFAPGLSHGRIVLIAVWPFFAMFVNAIRIFANKYLRKSHPRLKPIRLRPYQAFALPKQHSQQSQSTM